MMYQCNAAGNLCFVSADIIKLTCPSGVDVNFVCAKLLFLEVSRWL